MKSVMIEAYILRFGQQYLTVPYIRTDFIKENFMRYLRQHLTYYNGSVLLYQKFNIRQLFHLLKK